MGKDRTLNIKAAAMNFFFFVCYCAGMLYASTYLISKGFNTAEIGLMLCCGNVLATVLQDYLARKADEIGGSSLIYLTIGQMLVVMVCLFPLIFWEMPRVYVFFAYLIAVMLLMSAQTSLYSITVAYETAGKSIKFSAIRGVGSFGFAMAAVLLGKYLLNKPIDQVIIVAFCGAFITIISMLSLPKIRVEGSSNKETKQDIDNSEVEKESSGKEFFKRYPILLWMFTAFTILFSGHVFLNNYMAQIVQNVGGNSANLGFASMLAALCEMPAMFLYSKFRTWKSDGFWLLMAGICFTIKIGILALANNIFWIYVSQSMNFCTFGFFTPAYAYFANSVVEKADMVRGQSIGVAVMSLGGAFGSILGGGGMHFFGVTGSLFMITLFSTIGSILLVYNLNFKCAEYLN